MSGFGDHAKLHRNILFFFDFFLVVSIKFYKVESKILVVF